MCALFEAHGIMRSSVTCSPKQLSTNHKTLIWSKVLDILATPKPFYNLVSAMKTDSKKVTEFFQYNSTNYTDILENEYVCIIRRSW